VATPIPANQARVDAGSVARATGGRVVNSGQAAGAACGVTTDSRAVTAGSAFVALRGERHDGHAYAGAAIAAGAALVVVERGRAPAAAQGAAVVEVDDTLAAWGAIARGHVRAWRRARVGARVVAITGSAGKTTTKELCAALLRQVAPCHATAGNLNNRVGLPAVALGVEAAHRFAVLEMGMSVPGEIAALAAIAEPDVAVVTNVALAHAGGVGGTLADVAREKGAIFAGLRADGAAVANADDAAVMGEVGRAGSAARVTFGDAPGADVRLVARAPLGHAGSRVTVRRAGRDAIFVVPIAGQAAAIDFLAALAAAEAAVGGPIDDGLVAAALAGVEPLAGRMRVRRLGDGVLVLDDAYNANPASMRAALATLGEIDARRRVAILGEMKELGPLAEREHAALGADVAGAGVGLLVSCGGLADAIARDAESRGVTVVLAGDAARAAGAAVERVLPGDAVLVKASRSVGAERVVEALEARR
jgi:UDP-N-acetylmuramoyl-tripeptide--D-alanyl-D-alanine ligase